MKYNLKNRPSFRGKSLDSMTELAKDNAILECVQWFEAFERELRETLDWLDKWHPRTDKNMATKESWKHMVLEILGADLKQETTQ